ncbi:tRNA lysidine(34) synthetase TilS [Rothia sp. HMSC068F09]|uniref:tRNA lysidine(34) synthetase TilS n=1 Tax=Rothia sp. HMSC068F09 TaxID=1739378 RepID=UPI0008A2CF3F|nr:tRNA lysidine(34) synthetase TilS [Rothia sp. HMSC068F09]OFR69918.1 tRNA(Ile)-lysidine synthetase [Rothia sp. HMSC068F09]
MQNGRAGRLHPAVGTARRHLAAALEKLLGAGSIKATGRSRTSRTAPAPDAADLPLLLVACSGGPDSLALAAIAAHFARRGDVRVGAVIVDHSLQEGSAEVAAQTAQTLTDLGLHPVITEKVQVPAGNMGPEMAARTARYAAFEKVVKATGARAVLLGHTLDDQAETVLLGLSRGSGTRSLAGMPPVRVEGGVTYLRPFLGLRRTDMLDICEAETLTPWIDPTNADQSLMRARIRHSVLPYLEEHLGGDVARSLARTAAVAGPDADYLDEQAQTAYEQALLPAGTAVRGIEREDAVLLDRVRTAELHPALRLRVLATACKAAGGENPGFERLQALDAFTAEHATAGPVQMPGHVSAYRRRRVAHPVTGESVDALVLVPTRG